VLLQTELYCMQSLVTWDWTQGQVSQVRPISQEFFSHNYGLMAKFSQNLRLGILGLEIQLSTNVSSYKSEDHKSLRSCSPKLQGTLILHIRQESQVM